MTRCAVFMVTSVLRGPSNEFFVSRLPGFSFCPPFIRRLSRNLGALFGGHGFGASGTTFAPERSGCRVFALFLWSRRPVLDLPGGDVDHQLGSLAEISGTLAMLVGHAANMRRI